MTEQDREFSEAVGKKIRQRFSETKVWLDTVYPEWLLKQMSRDQIAWAIACYFEMEGRTNLCEMKDYPE